jgi:hypothetical protein
MLARVAVWDPMPTDDRSWVLEAAKSVPGVGETYHLVNPKTGAGMSIAFFDGRESMAQAHAAIERRAREIGWNDEPRPAPASVSVYEVVRS